MEGFPPRDQHTAPADSPPSRNCGTVATAALAALVEAAQGFTPLLDGAFATDLRAFGATLTPTQAATLGGLLGRFGNAVERQAGLDQADHLARLCAHAPGLAPLIRLLDAHTTECHDVTCPHGAEPPPGRGGFTPWAA